MEYFYRSYQYICSLHLFIKYFFLAVFIDIKVYNLMWMNSGWIMWMDLGDPEDVWRRIFHSWNNRIKKFIKTTGKITVNSKRLLGTVNKHYSELVIPLYSIQYHVQWSWRTREAKSCFVMIRKIYDDVVITKFCEIFSLVYFMECINNFLWIVFVK